MKHLHKAIYGALLVLGLAGVTPVPAVAGGHWDSVCNCMRPDHEYNTRRVERGPAQVINHERVVNHTRVVRGNTRLIQENRLVVHVKPIVHRDVVVHRVNTIVRDVELHRVNTTNKTRIVTAHVVVNREVPGEVRHVLERREVRGVNCHCGPEGPRYSDGGYERGGEVVSYRD